MSAAQPGRCYVADSVVQLSSGCASLPFLLRAVLYNVSQ